MTILITDEDVKGVLTYEDVIGALDDAYRQYGLGLYGGNDLIANSPIVPRSEMRIEGKHLPHLHPDIRSVNQTMGYLVDTGMIVVRWSFHLGEKSGMMDYLIDANTGEILAIIKARLAWLMRLGSEAAIGSKYLSRKDSKIVGMIGAGRTARALLPAVSKVRDIVKVFVYAGRPQDYNYAVKYSEEMSESLGIDIYPSEDPESVVKKADILVTATKSIQPIVKGKWVNEGLHINAIGADDPYKSELDAYTLKKADKLVIDYELSLETKEIRDAINQGILTRDDIYGHIGEIVSGKKPGREKASEITIFKDTGMTIPYVSLYDVIYKKVIEKNLGKIVDEKHTSYIYI
jgi:ornithine cyclodeaminase/alanine dehydrogenase-like protein (mu-crystallin family)